MMDYHSLFSVVSITNIPLRPISQMIARAMLELSTSDRNKVVKMVVSTYCEIKVSPLKRCFVAQHTRRYL